MPFVSIPADAWTAVATASGDTVVQVRSATSMYLTTESTSGLARDESLFVAPNEAVVFSDGKAIKAYSPNVAALVFYMAL